MADRTRDGAKLARVHRVREVQALLAQAEEARARDKAAAEASLRDRIAGLAAAVAPRQTTGEAGGEAPGGAASLAAAAHFRERLHASAAAAAARVRAADLHLARSRLATGGALRDRAATEKLLERARADEALAAARAHEDAPVAPGRRGIRHEPC